MKPTRYSATVRSLVAEKLLSDLNGFSETLPMVLRGFVQDKKLSTLSI